MYFDGLAQLLDVVKLGKVARSGLLATSLGTIILWIALLPPVLVNSAAAQSSYLLTPAISPGDVQRVKVAVEIQGQLKTNPDGKKINRLPMAVQATLAYEERLLAASGDSRRTARYYNNDTQADIQVNEIQQKVRLNDEHRLILVKTTKEEATFLSPQGPLTRDELDLLDVPGSTAVAPSLLPGREVRIGESWRPAESVLALLLGLEAVSQTDVSAVLTKVEEEVAIIDMSGVVQGADGGVATEIELKGKLNFALPEKRLTWLALALKENRAIGHAEPGFETTSRIRVAIQSAATPAHVTEKLLADLPEGSDTGAALLRFESAKGGFRLLHDRRWRMMADRTDVAILRLVDRGDLIAQCNISQLPDMSPGKHLSLGEFKAEIEEALGKSFGQVVEATETKTDSGLRVLRIVASGVSSELPIQWTYYHVSNDQGRRAAYVFTMESRLIERFGVADELLTSSFEFIARAAPTPAEPEAGDNTGAKKPASAGNGKSAARPSTVLPKMPSRR